MTNIINSTLLEGKLWAIRQSYKVSTKSQNLFCFSGKHFIKIVKLINVLTLLYFLSQQYNHWIMHQRINAQKTQGATKHWLTRFPLFVICTENVCVCGGACL